MSFSIRTKDSDFTMIHFDEDAQYSSYVSSVRATLYTDSVVIPEDVENGEYKHVERYDVENADGGSDADSSE